MEDLLYKCKYCGDFNINTKHLTKCHNINAIELSENMKNIMNIDDLWLKNKQIEYKKQIIFLKRSK